MNVPLLPCWHNPVLDASAFIVGRVQASMVLIEKQLHYIKKGGGGKPSAVNLDPCVGNVSAVHLSACKDDQGWLVGVCVTFTTFDVEENSPNRQTEQLPPLLARWDYEETFTDPETGHQSTHWKEMNEGACRMLEAAYNKVWDSWGKAIA